MSGANGGAQVGQVLGEKRQSAAGAAVADICLGNFANSKREKTPFHAGNTWKGECVGDP